MAGTIPLSMTQQFDVFGKPLIGGQLYIIQAGTVSTPQDAFVDTALTIKQPYPIPLDAAGRVPQFFLADGTVKLRLQDRTGVVQLAADSVLVIGPSAGGGGGGTTVDPTQLIQTGNMILRYGFGSIAGYVRLNLLTIGSATSGATERANADTQALYLYLWGIDPNLSVGNPPNNAIPGSGRGANALADWTANKQITLPDWRGYGIGCLDDMGNSAAGRLGGYFANPTVLGAAGGGPSMQLAAGHLAPHTHSGVTAAENAQHNHNWTAPTNRATGALVNNSASLFFWTGTGSESTGVENQTHAHGFATDSGAGLASTPFSIISPRKLCTAYIKL